MMKIDRIPIISIALCAFFAPLEKFSTYVEWPISFTLKVHMLLLPFVTYSLLKNMFFYRYKWISWSSMLMSSVIVVVTFLSTVASDDGARVTAVMFRLYSILLLLSVIFSVKTHEDVVLLLKAVFISGLVSALYGYVQFIQFYFGYDTSFFLDGLLSSPERIGYAETTSLPVVGNVPRLTGFNYDPNIYAIVLLVAIVAGSSLQLIALQKKWILGMFIMFFPFIMSLSRAAYLIAITLYIVIPFILEGRLRVRLSHLVASVFVAVLMVLFWDAIVQRFSSEGSLSTDYHVLFGSAAIQLGMNNPLIGHGIDTFENTFLNSTFNPGLTRANAHSLPISVFFEAGLVGVFVYLSFMLLIIYALISGVYREGIHRTPLQYTVVPFGVLVVMLLLHNIVNNYFHMEFVSILFGFALATASMSRSLMDRYRVDNSWNI